MPPYYLVNPAIKISLLSKNERICQIFGHRIYIWLYQLQGTHAHTPLIISLYQLPGGLLALAIKIPKLAAAIAAKYITNRDVTPFEISAA